MKQLIYFCVVLLFLPMLVFANEFHHSSMAERKLLEISKIISLSDFQKSKIVDAYEKYEKTCDSIDCNVNDIKESVDLIYKAKLQLHKSIIGVLTDIQIAKYVNIAFSPEIAAKTEYKVSLLREGNAYSATELEVMRKQIYGYLMLEKVVYFRDKYDFDKQKNNISRLKIVQPNCLKESNNREKQKGLGKLIKGKINWK